MTRLEYLLTCLSEEAAEVVHITCKTQRFGLEECRPGGTISNVDGLNEELNQLLAVVGMLIEEGADIGYCQEIIDQKREKVEKYYEYSKDLGIIHE